MEVEFQKRDDGGSNAIIDRGDGVRLRLRSYDRTLHVPHDAAHFIGERSLQVNDGLWGSIAAGALFDSIEVISGRQRHDRKKLSDDVRRRNAESLRLAETVVGVLLDGIDRDGPAVKHNLDRAWGITQVGNSPFSSEQAGRAVEELRTLREDWKRLTPGDPGPRFSWPANSAQGRSGRRGLPGRVSTGRRSSS